MSSPATAAPGATPTLAAVATQVLVSVRTLSATSRSARTYATTKAGAMAAPVSASTTPSGAGAEHEHYRQEQSGG